MPNRRTAALAATVSTALVIGVAVAVVPPAAAHGYVSAPYSRALACKMGLNTNCGSIVYEPQSLEAPKGYPQAGPADGRIASAGGQFPRLDEQTYGRWYKNEISPGPLRVGWTYTAPHRTSQWRYYLTKQSWDPSGPLERRDFDLISTVTHDGSAASTNLTHTIPIPASRSGYHVILAVWDVADTTNAFYNVIDVTITGSAAPLDPGQPTTPGGGQPAPDDAEAPGVPSMVHSMGQTTTSVDLMWQAPADNTAVTGYTVLRNGTEVARPTSARYLDTGLAAGTTYVYTVLARDAAGNVSAASAPFTVTTTAVATAAPTPAPSTTPTPTTMPAPAPATATTPTPAPTGPATPPAWSATGRYRVGDQVTFNGTRYECIQSYQGWGDPNWINAPSLWRAL